MNQGFIGWTLFLIASIFMLTLAFLDKPSTGLNVAGAILFVAAVGWASARSHEQEREGTARAWREFARKTRLTFVGGESAFFDQNSPACLQGEFRGYYASIKLVPEQSSGDNGVSRVFTRTIILVDDEGQCSLEVQDRKHRKRKSGTDDLLSGDAELERKIHMRGSPPAFSRAALKRIVRNKDLLLARPNWRRPSIKLDHSELVCLQHGVHTNTTRQKAWLDLLCDLADLAERTGKR